MRSWRFFSASIAETMKSCQMSAGYVPPATGAPGYSVFIGLSASG